MFFRSCRLIYCFWGKCSWTCCSQLKKRLLNLAMMPFWTDFVLRGKPKTPGSRWVCMIYVSYEGNPNQASRNHPIYLQTLGWSSKCQKERGMDHLPTSDFQGRFALSFIESWNDPPSSLLRKIPSKLLPFRVQSFAENILKIIFSQYPKRGLYLRWTMKKRVSDALGFLWGHHEAPCMSNIQPVTKGKILSFN